MNPLQQGFAAGYANLSGWADLLDRINVFPVADADTGANFRVTLAPLREQGWDKQDMARRLVRFATGNSGNIAAAFFAEMVQADGLVDLPERIQLGRDRAWQAVVEPRRGTMLDVMDALVMHLGKHPDIASGPHALLDGLQRAVESTYLALPDLQAAGVVDAGALGLYLFLAGFFQTVVGSELPLTPPTELFPGRLSVVQTYRATATTLHCVETFLHPQPGSKPDLKQLSAQGESVVLSARDLGIKIHVHTENPRQLHEELQAMGEVVGWHEERITVGTGGGAATGQQIGCVHILTDAAGSLPRTMAMAHGITLLDSYIVDGVTARPESLCQPDEVYGVMRQGRRLTTGQASLRERHVHFLSACKLYGPCLYLCVGSAFTGNYAVARNWQTAHDSKNRFRVMDTGAASGRLAVIALFTHRFARTATSVEEVWEYAHKLVETCREYVFIDCLRYLVAGGRVGRASGLVGDFLQLKPVISPMPDGVRKIAMVRTPQAQLAFARQRLESEVDDSQHTLLLVQYSDNRPWVEENVLPIVRELLPQAECHVVPLSLTSGVHMGPGTWSLAFGGGG
ncbi:MAG: DegV family protein [Desulfobulbus sp.]